MKSQLIELNHVDSTNNYATALAHAGMAQHGMCVFTHDQTKGKGQRSKDWISQKRKNILLSIIFKPAQLDASQMFLLSKAVAVGSCTFLKRYLPDEVSIKWPNDIYWRDRKAGGILIENILQGSRWKYAICGIGINVNQVDFYDLQNKAVSIKQITGIQFQPLVLAMELVGDVQAEYDRLIFDPLEVEVAYKKNLYKLDQMVSLKEGTRIFDAIIKNVTSSGELVVEHALQEVFEVGQIEWCIKDNWK
jgi:BirA family biotin operon repressor/biotin-[acetyl-CoA-carboxylase] ligase